MDATPKRGRGTFDGWSKSSLKSLLEGCSWQWALTRLAGLPGGSTPHSAAGTGMHAAIEWHEARRIAGQDTPELWELLWEASSEAYRDGENIPPDFAAIHGGPQQAARWACDLTITWHDSDVRERLLTYTPLAVEPHIETPNVPGPNTLRGYLDWVGRDDDGVLTVIDYKSASGLERWKNPDHHLLEAAVYLYLVSTSDHWTGDEPIRMEWHVVSRKDTAKILEGPTFSPDIIDFVYDRVSEAQAIVDGNMLSPNPSWGLCSDRWCPFYHGCQVTGVLGPDMVDFRPASDRASSLRAPDAALAVPSPTPPSGEGAAEPHTSHNRGDTDNDSRKE